MRFNRPRYPLSLRSLIGIVVLPLLAQGVSEAQVTGRVINHLGKPLPNAMVTYTNLANRLVWTFAGEDGTFTLPDPAKTVWGGTISFLPVTAVNYKVATPRSVGLNPALAGRTVYITVGGDREVSVALYTMAGKVAAKRRLTIAESGRCGIDPFQGINGQSAAGIYLAKISSGGESALVPVPYFGASRAAAAAAALPSTAGTAYHRAAEPCLSAIDQIRVGRTNYSPVITSIDGYTRTLGDITLHPINIEARIDSVIAAWPDSSFVIVNQCIMHNNWDLPQTSAEKSAGAHFMAGDVKPNVTGDPRLAASYAQYMDSYRMAHYNGKFKIPLMAGYDAVHGVNMCDNAVIFPHAVGMGATRDLELVQVAYRVTAIEMAGTGCPWTFAPCVAVARNIGWGRTYESFGETPDLVARMTKAAIVGLQGFDLSHPLAVAACAKHFAGDGGTAKGSSPEPGALFDRGNTNTGTDEVLRKIHLAPYKAALEVGVASIMASFSSWNGAAMHANKTLLTDWLKNQMGFKGWVCGDFNGHLLITGGEEACLMAGLDMPMPAMLAPQKFGNPYLKMYEAGGDKKARVLDAARRLLRMKFAMGLFDRSPQTNPEVTALVGCQLHRDVARACVRESMVLLKNEGSALPLKKTARVHLIGTHADNLGFQCGGWTLGWMEPNLPNSAFIGATTIKEGFEKLSQGKITYSDNANAIPADADVVVVVFGERPHSEWFGDTDDLGPTDWKILPGGGSPTQLIDGAKKAKKPIVGICISSRPLIVKSYIDSLSAFVCVWLPGTEGGGIAEVMYGDYDFKGTLPHSWPREAAQLPLNSTAAEYGGDQGDLKGAAGAPQWPYGYGLSCKSGVLKAPF